MPGSAFRLNRQATHPVIAARKTGDLDHHQPVFHTLADSASSFGSVPSGRTARQQRMSWTASWRSQRPHKLWEDVLDMTADGFQNAGFEIADGVIKEPVLPPIFPSLSFALPTSYERRSATLEDDVDSNYSGVHGTGSEWSDYEDEPIIDAYQSTAFVDDYAMDVPECASPLLDDMSPTAEPGSSPGPVTPFGDYVDRAVTCPVKVAVVHEQQPLYEASGCGPHCSQCRQQQVVSLVEKPAPIVTPSATDVYRKVADHFSSWISDYVWKLCTTIPGSSELSPAHPSTPPADLSSSVRSLLLSTILQPSAICLALKYISRLPVFLGPMYLAREYSAEAYFRASLLGSPEAYNREDMETQAPFRLIVLGFMFANKWLDDHTFSNKTWHSISGIPIQWLNELESRALRVFGYDLSISQEDWKQWLVQLSSYHTSLLSSPVQYPQPISRPSSNPHGTIRKILEDLSEASSAKVCGDDCCGSQRPVPAFIGLAERQHEREEQYSMQDIDLDEGGPLREEYLPKRRSSTSATARRCSKVTDSRRSSLILEPPAIERNLPPPAKWSPEADEPIGRGKDQFHRLVLGPRAFNELPPPAPLLHTQPPPSMVQPWPVTSGYVPGPHYRYNGNGFAAQSAQRGVQSAYPSGCTYVVPVVSPPHSSWPPSTYGMVGAPPVYQHPAVLWCRA